MTSIEIADKAAKEHNTVVVSHYDGQLSFATMDLIHYKINKTDTETYCVIYLQPASPPE